MSDQRNGGIFWTEKTWNPLRGCSRVSDGCVNCYAEEMAVRFCGEGGPYEGTINPETKRWSGEIRFVQEKLQDPLRWSRPRRVFVNSMSDLFHENVPDEFIDKVFAVMALAPQHTFQVLTKRAKRMIDYLSDPDVGRRIGLAEIEFAKLSKHYKPIGEQRQMPLANVWLGVTAENQKAADERIPLLLQTPAAVRWVSMEPLLGAVDLAKISPSIFAAKANALTGNWKWEGGPNRRESPALDWVVVGGESGKNARPMHPAWARSLRNQCRQAGVPFLFKQWGEFAPSKIEQNDTTKSIGIDNNPSVAWPDGTIAYGCAEERGGNGTRLVRYGKKNAGRLLDGVEYDGYPK